MGVSPRQLLILIHRHKCSRIACKKWVQLDGWEGRQATLPGGTVACAVLKDREKLTSLRRLLWFPLAFKHPLPTYGLLLMFESYTLFNVCAICIQYAIFWTSPSRKRYGAFSLTRARLIHQGRLERTGVGSGTVGGWGSQGQVVGLVLLFPFWSLLFLEICVLLMITLHQRTVP